MPWGPAWSPDLERDYGMFCRRSNGFKRAVDREVEAILTKPLHYKPLLALPDHEIGPRLHVDPLVALSSGELGLSERTPRRVRLQAVLPRAMRSTSCAAPPPVTTQPRRGGSAPRPP